MKAIALTLIILITACFLNFLRKSVDNFHIAQIFPFCDGRKVSGEYAIGGVVILLILLWGILRLNSSDDDK
jgi:hypothetical protein